MNHTFAHYGGSLSNFRIDCKFYTIMHSSLTHHRFLLCLGLLPSSPTEQFPLKLLKSHPRIEHYTPCFEDCIEYRLHILKTGIVTLLEHKKYTVIHSLFRHEYVEAVVFLNKDDYRRGENEVRLVFDRSIQTDSTPYLDLLSNRTLILMTNRLGVGAHRSPLSNVGCIKCCGQRPVKYHPKHPWPLVKNLVKMQHCFHIQSL